MLSSINAGLIPPDGANAVVPMAFAFGGLAQIIAGILEYANGNTFGMVAFTSYGTFWWWYAFMVWTIGAGLDQGTGTGRGCGRTGALGHLHPGPVGFHVQKPNKAVWTVFLLLWITFFLLSAGDFGVRGTPKILAAISEF